MSINVSKTRLSFDMSIGGKVVPRNEYVTPNGAAFIKWCGLLINTKTLDVQVSSHAACSRHAGLREAVPWQ